MFVGIDLQKILEDMQFLRIIYKVVVKRLFLCVSGVSMLIRGLSQKQRAELLWIPPL